MRPKIIVNEIGESSEISKEFIYTVTKVSSSTVRPIGSNYEISLYIDDSGAIRALVTFKSGDKDRLEEYIESLIEEIESSLFEENSYIILKGCNIDEEDRESCAKVTMNYNFVSAKPL